MQHNSRNHRLEKIEARPDWRREKRLVKPLEARLASGLETFTEKTKWPLAVSKMNITMRPQSRRLPKKRIVSKQTRISIRLQQKHFELKNRLAKIYNSNDELRDN